MSDQLAFDDDRDTAAESRSNREQFSVDVCDSCTGGPESESESEQRNILLVLLFHQN